MLDATVFLATADELEALREDVLNFCGEELGLSDLLVVGDFLYEIGKIVQRGLRECIFADGQLFGFVGSGETEIVGFDATDLRAVAGVGMNGDEEIRVGAIGDGGAFFERDVSYRPCG